MLARLDERPGAALPSERKAHEWLEVVARYRDPRLARSLLEIVITLIPFVAFWAASYAALSVGWWLSLLLAIPAAGFLLRLFLIQHDCGHLSFFPTRAANDWVGRLLGVLTLTPYDVWKRSHAIHHASSGNLDKRGTGDVYTLTVSEFPGIVAAQQARLPSVPAPVRDVRARPVLRVLPAAAPALRPDARRLAAMDQCHGHQPGDPAGLRADDLPDRLAGVRAGSRPHRADGRDDRHLAVLRAASVRGYGVGRHQELVAAACRAVRQLVL